MAEESLFGELSSIQWRIMMLRRGLVMVFATTSYAVEGGTLIFIFLRDHFLIILRDTALKKWVYGSFASIERPIFWIRRYLFGVGVCVRYRSYYNSLTAPMKEYYRKMKRKL